LESNDEIVEKIVKRLRYYRSMGVEPLSLATGCAVKVDLLRVVYPAMEEIRRRLENVTIADREDADTFYGDPSSVSLNRVMIGLGEERSPTLRLKADARAIILIQIHQMDANEPLKFIKKVLPAYRTISRCAPKIRIGKGHSIVTPFREDEFMMADIISYEKGENVILANNDTMHIIDPTSDPADYRQVSGAISNSLNDLFVYGGYRDIKIAPLLNAPDEGLREEMMSNARKFAESIGARLVEVEQPKRGKLLLGATVLASSDKKPPTFHKEVDKGMKLISTRPFGELAPITVYLSTAIDKSIIDDLEEKGIGLSELEKMKEKAFDMISTPNKGLGEVLAKYLPDVNEDYRKDQHVACATDVTGQGILILWEISKLTNSHIKVYNFPLLFPEISQFATESFLMPNATAGTNGGFVIVAPEEIHEEIMKELSLKGYEPKVIGEVLEKGKAMVEAPRSVAKYVIDEEILSKFTLKG